MRLARLGTATSVLLASGVAGSWPAPAAPARVVVNDNRVAAGVLKRDTLRVNLVLQRAEWYPEAENGPHVTVEAFSEAGKAPRIPAPLIRVRASTVIRATVRNNLTDSTAHIIGLGTHPIAVGDTLHLKPGASAEVTFLAGVPGTYLYRAVIGNDPDGAIGDEEHETTGGAFVVDPLAGSRPDRIFVLNIVDYNIDSTHRKQALGINGKSWPYTERVAMTVGDSLRWRVINGTARGHPMHLHGFYFRTTAAGTGIAATDVPADQQFLAVTDSYARWSTREIAWSPDRPGNWLFHCHLTFHVVPDARLDHGPADEHETHSTDPLEHMAGLVMGITVAPRAGESYLRAAAPRQLDLFMNEGGPRGSMEKTFSYILQNGPTPPAKDSMLIPGSLLLLTRGVPVDITVHNRTQQPGGIHWHGIELESWSDGVMGWSSRGSAMAPAIEPGKSFTAHLSLPRAGTFMYHTHMNDLEQVTNGAVGPIVVLEPGETFDPNRDHVYITFWHGETGTFLVNGDSTGSAPLEIVGGLVQRFRFINIGPANLVRFTLRRDTTTVEWRARAKDGADLSENLRTLRPATFAVNVGETYDFEFTPPTRPGSYELSARFNAAAAPTTWRQKLVVK